MKAKRIIRFTLISFVAIIVIGVLGMLVWAKTGTYPARAVALSALESTDRVTITQVIFPRESGLDHNPIQHCGIIFSEGNDDEEKKDVQPRV
jgi:hypothetical protein